MHELLEDGCRLKGGGNSVDAEVAETCGVPGAEASFLRDGRCVPGSSVRERMTTSDGQVFKNDEIII